MTHHRYDRRLPKRTEGFAWGRSIDKVLGGHVLTYRLFRRDLAGKLHIETRTFQLNDHRRHIALQLLIARRQLRERVDAYQRSNGLGPSQDQVARTDGDAR